MIIQNMSLSGSFGNKRSKWGPFILYLVVWAAAIAVFWLFTDGSDALGYSLVFLWVFLPFAAFVSSVLIGKNDCWGTGKWLMAILFGVLYMLAEYGTFGLANMAGTGRFHLPEFVMILYGMAVSFAGLAVGAVIRRYKRNKKCRK